MPLAQAGLTAPDYAVLGLYLVVVIGLGAYFSRGDSDTEGYLLGGRSMPWWVIGVSYIASLLSTVSMVGAPGEGYKNGMTAVLWPTFGLFLSLGFFFLFVRFYFQTRTFTPFEYLERRYGWKSRAAAAGIYCIARGLYLATVLFAAAKVFQGTGNWSVPWTIVLVGGVGIFYTTLGGMRAVVWTDFLQFLVLVGGIVIVLLKATTSMPGGVAGVLQFAAEKDHLFPDLKDPSFFTLDPFVRLTLWAILFRAVADHLFYKSADQILIQRMLATKGYWHAFRSVVTGSVLGPIILLVLYFVGLCMFRHYAALPAAERPPADLALFRYITTQLPTPVPGLIVAAMLAAIMSTLDSGINSLATVITKDFYLRFSQPGAGEAAQVRFSRWMTVVAGVAIIGVAVGIAALAASVRGTVLESSGVWMSLLVVLAPVFLLGVSSRRARQWHALTGLAVGVAVTAAMTFWYYHTKHRGLEANFFLVAVVPFLATLVTAFGLSRFAPRAGGETLANLTLWTLRSRRA